MTSGETIQRTNPYCPSDAPVRVLFEDADLAVVVKPTNLLSVPGKGKEKRDCAERRLFLDGRKFVRAAHRLDQDTSGLLIFGMSPEGHRAASMMFEARGVTKTYEAKCAIVNPPADKSWLIDLPIALDWPNRPKHHVDFETGKPSQTHVEVLESDGEHVRVRLTPITGRSHQLRVHLAHVGLPILGDTLYNEALDPSHTRLCLHAKSLEFTHPLTGEAMAFDDPTPF